MMNEVQFRIVRNKSIPNVPTERLRGDLGRIHEQYHTQAGLHEFDAPRRQLVDMGMKGLKIRDELRNRGESSGIECRWCGT